jgi:large repetitive protein
MKRFLQNIKLLKNFSTLGNFITFPRRIFLCFFSTIIFFFLFSFSNAQIKSVSNNSVVQSLNSSSDLVFGKISQRNPFFSQSEYFNQKNYNSDFASSAFTPTTSTGTGGDWNNAATWVGGIIPGPGEHVTIVSGAIVTIKDNTATCQNITINTNGTLTVSGSFNLEVNGSWVNDGTFNAGTGTVSFKGNINSTISGRSSTAFYNIVVDKGATTSTILEATGAGGGDISNIGNITLIHGLFEMTGGIFQFTSNPNIPNGAGFWVKGATLNSVAAAPGFSIDNNGWIKVSTGTLNVGTASGNDLHTATGGILQIDGGVVNVSGSLYNSAGTALITGGTTNLATVGNNSAQGSFYMSPSTDLTISGNPLIIINKQTSGSGGDITILNSAEAKKSITGSRF